MSTTVKAKFTGTTYEEAAAYLGDRTSAIIAHNTFLNRRTPDAIALRLIGTDIVTWRSDGAVILNSGGWRTVTTRNRMRQYMPKWMALHVCRGRWTISFTYGESFGEAEAVREVDFVDGLTLFATNATSR